MSRIPIFIEKKDRKNWNRATETCIFISCDSNTTSEVEDTGDELDNTVIDELAENYMNNVNVRNVSLFSEEDDSVTGFELESDYINEAETHHGDKQNSINTSISLAVVSCSKGIVNATCNCRVCEVAVVKNNQLAPSKNNVISAELSKNNMKETGGIQLIEEFGRETKMKSLIPKPAARLRAGVVAMTPAPIKRNKSKHSKTNDCETDPKQEIKQNILTGTENINSFQQMDINKELISMKVVNNTEKKETFYQIETSTEVSQVSSENDAYFKKESIIRDKKMLAGESTLSKSCHEFEDSEPECAQQENKLRKMLDKNNLMQKSSILQEIDIDITEKNHDNSEVAEVQKLDDQNETNCKITAFVHKYSPSELASEKKLDKMSRIPRKRSNSSERSLVHLRIPLSTSASPIESPSPGHSSSVSRSRERSSSNERSPICSRIPMSTYSSLVQTSTESRSSERSNSNERSPVRSQIPMSTHPSHVQTSTESRSRERSISNERSPIPSQIPMSTHASPRRHHGSPSPIRSSASVLTESSRSPVRNTFHHAESPASKLPPKSPVYSRTSPSVTKRRSLSSRSTSASPHCVSIRSPSPRDSAEEVTSSLRKLTCLAQKQIKVLQSNVQNSGKNPSQRDSPSKNEPCTSRSKLVLNKQACPQIDHTDTWCKRNLPRAPEKRTIRYGQRCITSVNSPTEGNAAVAKRPTATGNAAVSKKPTATANAGVAAPKGNAAATTGGSKKRPVWDLKGRLQDMEQHMKQKEQQMTVWSDRIGLLENKNIQLSGTVAEREEVATSVGKAKEFLQQKLEETESELHSIKTKLERETENFEFTKATLRRQKEALESELHALQTKAAGLETSIAQLTSAQAGLKSELTSTQVSLNKALNEGQEKDEELARLTGIIEDNTNTIADYEQKAREFETDRRKLHNTIQELKGNIRVFCRIRPLIGDELYGSDGEIHHMNIPDDDEKTIELEKLSDVSLSESTINGTKRAANGRYTFSFDRVFRPDSTQTEVFEEISQLVQSALDGYNVCIFAYGQTGSGKTYTMEGPSVEREETMGMISRSLVQIFNTTRDLEESGWQYEFEASFLEIYNETIRDLLGSHGADVKHDIKLGTSGKDVTVTNLTTQQVTRREQIVTLLRTASKNRAVGETQCNERSSRSHSVFRLKITGSNEITGENSAGTLNLIDLAGSERLKDSGATGQRLKETQNINKSLATLGNVIMALGNKDSFVPYRNSKLTYLLQNSLGGNSKTLMFVNVSPREEHFSETVNSLRFATKVNQCNIGTATKKSK